MATKIGFIGLGIMGGSMAKNLSRAYPGLKIFDTDPHKVEALVQANDPASSPWVVSAVSAEELGAECSLVLLSLPTSEVVTSCHGNCARSRIGSWNCGFVPQFLIT